MNVFQDTPQNSTASVTCWVYCCRLTLYWFMMHPHP